MFCAANGSLSAMEALLEAGASPERLDLSSSSALWYAACQGHDEAALLLLSHCTVVADCLDLPSVSGHTPLSVAAACGHVTVCNGLLAARARLDGVGAEAVTPLFHAAIGGHLETARLLLDARANPRWRSRDQVGEGEETQAEGVGEGEGEMERRRDSEPAARISWPAPIPHVF